jgi:serpin B
MKLHAKSISIGLITFLLVACQKTAVVSPNTNNNTPLTSSQIVENNNKFALDIYQALVDENENQLISPYSISSALAMVYAGADGNTATQMQKVLGFGANDLMFHQDFSQVKINTPADSEISIVNKIWRSTNMSFLPDFESTMNNTYSAPIVPIDFTQTAMARQQINNWVGQETNQLIPDLLPDGFIKANTATVLVNAMYLKADWEVPFDSFSTTKKAIKTTAGTDSAFVMQNDIPCQALKFVEDADTEILELYLKDKKSSVVVILPKDQSVGINTFVQNMTATQLNTWLANLATPNFPNSNFDVNIPKFNFKSDFDLKQTMESLGMTDAFSGAANFSKMADASLQIDEIKHKTVIDAHEGGIEAAAATAVGIVFTSVPPVARTVNIDRPFVILVREIETGSILFIGHVQNPNL